MVEPTFNTEDIDEFLDRIRIAKLKAEMRGQQQQIDRPSVVTIRRLEAENARLKEALRECVEGYDKSMLYVADPENPFTAAITKAREVLGDA